MIRWYLAQALRDLANKIDPHYRFSDGKAAADWLLSPNTTSTAEKVTVTYLNPPHRIGSDG